MLLHTEKLCKKIIIVNGYHAQAMLIFPCGCVVHYIKLSCVWNRSQHQRKPKKARNKTKRYVSCPLAITENEIDEQFEAEIQHLLKIKVMHDPTFCLFTPTLRTANALSLRKSSAILQFWDFVLGDSAFRLVGISNLFKVKNALQSSSGKVDLWFMDKFERYRIRHLFNGNVLEWKFRNIEKTLKISFELI